MAGGLAAKGAEAQQTWLIRIEVCVSCMLSKAIVMCASSY